MPRITATELGRRRRKAQEKVSRWERRMSLALTKLKEARRRLAYYDKAVDEALAHSTDMVDVAEPQRRIVVGEGQEG